LNKEVSDFQDHAVDNHPLSVAYFGDSDMTIENIGIFNDCDEANGSNDVLYTVKEEIYETRDDQEICEQIFPIKSEVAIDDVVPSEVDYQMSSEGHEFQNSEGSQMEEISQVATVHEGQKTSTVKQRKKKFKCSNCDACFVRMDRLKKHIVTKHGYEGLNKFKCTICDEGFTLKQNLKKHITSIHDSHHKPFKCSICEASFTQKKSMQVHIATVHEGKKPFKCSICDDRFTQIASMRRHIATIHEGQKAFMCHICDRSFTQKGSMETHIASVHIDYFESGQLDQL
jgi:uncharacterized C2H2 Zn-finger protein